MLTKQWITKNVWAIYGDTQEEIGKAFVRFQEFYENKDLKGKKDITVKDVEDWWDKESEDHETKESYYTFWAGFNIPGSVIIKLLTSSTFRIGYPTYPWWNAEEDQLLDLLYDMPAVDIANSYFIGLSKTSTNVLDHEVAHALFSTNESYKSAQLRNLAHLPEFVYEDLRTNLLSMGYHPSVIRDEMQAYLSTYTESLFESFQTILYSTHTDPFEETFKTFTASVNLPSNEPANEGKYDRED